jgi:hypothetical protein
MGKGEFLVIPTGLGGQIFLLYFHAAFSATYRLDTRQSNHDDNDVYLTPLRS